MEIITLGNQPCLIRYRVVTKDMKSLGLDRNPTILQYPVGEWYFLPTEKVKEGKDDVGGIWVTRRLSDAKKMSKYMMNRYEVDTRIFKAVIDKILFENSYRIKTNGIYLMDEIETYL